MQFQIERVPFQGFVSLMPDETQGAMTASEIKAKITKAMAGR
ncbi:MAG: hypothetical protein NWQ54_02425 [Paraglaciecola sp.]|nr:hypothetical protein [Paraglaciecola sp.]